LVRALAFPAGAVERFDTWQVTGLRATSSVDFAVHDVEVPERHGFSVFGAPREPGPLYRVPFASIAEASFAAVALGIGRGAIDGFTVLARGKAAWGGGILAGQAATQVRFAEAEVSLAAARAGFAAVTDGAWEAVRGGRSLGAAGEAQIRLACVHAAQTATRSADLLHGLAGMSPLFPESLFGRAWRDVHTVSQHALLAPEGAATAAATLLAGE
jgi:alkylation response protein AidB-like acyl-CoA dehydrogenase